MKTKDKLSFYLIVVVLSTMSLTSLRTLKSTNFDNNKNGLDTLKTDKETGLALGPGFDMVRAHCTSCHSSKLILQYRTSRQGWLDKIRWMQQKQNLWELGEAEPIILDYLAKHYPAIEKTDRRTPLKDVTWYKLHH